MDRWIYAPQSSITRITQAQVQNIITLIINLASFLHVGFDRLALRLCEAP